MEMKNNTKGQTFEDIWLLTCFNLLILFGVNLLFNSWINDGPRVFYRDDLWCVISCINTGSGFDYIFSTGANKFRPIAYAAIYFSYLLSNGSYEIIDEILLGLNFLNSVLVFYFAFWLQKDEQHVKRIIRSLACGILYIASRFAYYNISEVFGIMEGLGILFSLSMLFSLIVYLQINIRKYYVYATILYGAVLYTHERYFVLFVLFLLVIFIKKVNLKQFCKMIVFPFLLLLSFWSSRLFLFGGRALDGTGGTDIKDTFNFLDMLKLCRSQVGYILGFQCGPAYLSGIHVSDVSRWINIFLCLRLIVILGIVLLFLRLLITNKEFREMHIKSFILFLVFIGSCIISSSVTIRVEMRWIYVSYSACLIMVFWMMYVISIHYETGTIRKLLLLCSLIITLIAEQYYREHYINIYYWTDKELAQSIYKATVDVYGDEMENKNLIFLISEEHDDDFLETEEYWRQFFSPYFYSENITVSYKRSIQGVKDCITPKSIVLFEDLKNNRYVDITSAFPLGVNITYKYGIYEDGWCDPDCEFEISNYQDEKVTLTFYYPNDVVPIGKEGGLIIINGEKEVEFSLTGNSTTIGIELPKQDTNSIRILSDYWVYENTGRSDDGRVSCVLQITAEK